MLAQLKSYSGKIGDGVTSGGKLAKNGVNSLYKTAMNHPKTSAAVVLGTGAAAALIWLVQRNGGFSALRKEVLARVRGKSRRARIARAA
jgi:hypothetical protein